MRRLLLATTLVLSVSAKAEPQQHYWPNWLPFWQRPQPAATPTPSPTATPEASELTDEIEARIAAERERAEKRALAIEAMRKGNYAVAYYHWFPLAESGDGDAQFGIGWMYHNGYGLVIDDHQTLRWWSQAAQQGHLDAMFALGLLYAEGELDVESDARWAADLYLKAARGGHQEARSMLRELLGRGGKRMDAFTAGWRLEDWALFGTPLRVKAERANLRSAPDLESKIIGGLSARGELVELSRNGRWVEVIAPSTNRGGWVHDSLVERPPSSPDEAQRNPGEAEPAKPPIAPKPSE